MDREAARRPSRRRVFTAIRSWRVAQRQSDAERAGGRAGSRTAKGRRRRLSENIDAWLPEGDEDGIEDQRDVQDADDVSRARGPDGGSGRVRPMSEIDTRTKSATPEIEITPEMVEAGAEVVWEAFDDVLAFGSETGRLVARRVFSAMESKKLGLSARR